MAAKAHMPTKKAMQDNPRIGKVLLTLDVSPRSRTALETAAALAAELDAELAGLFVEDINLLRVGGLPFTRELGFLSHDSRTFALEDVEQALRHEAGEAQRLLAETAARLQLRWSFHIVRGKIADELFALAGELDLVVLGNRARMGMRSLGYFLVETLPGLTRPTRESRPVVAVYDGSASSHRVLELAQRLALSGSLELRLLVVASTADEFSSRAREAKILLAQAGITPVTCQYISSARTGDLATAARQEGAGVLVLYGDRRFREGEGFATLLNEIDCPVILVG